jgi:hypothetical protein
MGGWAFPVKEHTKNFLNGWSLKDILILAGILGGIIHNSSTTADVSVSANNAVERGVEHIEAKLATLTEHQSGQDRFLADHETRIRYLEQFKKVQ